MKTFTMMLAVGVLAASSGMASAGQDPTAFQQLYPNGDHGARQVTNFRADKTGSRCNGVSYGTGAQSCGTATGGPVGGINSRN